VKNVYLKSTFADIKNSLGRFIAIILIILMGVLLFVGIKSVGPNLENTGSRVIKTQNLSDTQLVSTMGLTKADQTAVEKITGVQAELGHSFAYAESSAQQNLQVYSYDAKQKQNKLIVKSGHLPKNKNELVLDQELKDTYKLGQTITIKNSQLTTSQFKVTGFVESPVYISKTERGSTTIGDGQLDGFAYLSAQAFSNDTYSILYVTFANVKDVGQFSDEYKTIMTKNEEKLDKVLATRKTERRNELQREATAKLATEGETLAASEKQLTAAKAQLEAAKAQLATQKAQLAESGQASAEATASITATETQLAATEKTLTENAAKLATGKQAYEKAQSTIKNMAKPTFITTLRNSNPGFNEYQSLANQIDAIANVFPVFFFFIAILITFTTMTRMIEENRKEIGTLKALGYRGTEIASKYIIYALLAAFVGTIIGTVVGTKLLPTIVFSMFNAEYIFTGYTTNFVLVPIVIAIGAALIATLGSSLLVLIK
jgi:putative ABC transport system permease protein